MNSQRRSETPIVLVHGLFGNLSAPEILRAFGENQVLAPDLIGYGDKKEVSTKNLNLRDQSKHIAEFITGLNTKVHLVGHSVGGAISALVAHDHGELVASYISVEGNFTLNDAFWSSQIAKKSDEEVEAIIDGYSSDPDAWMVAAGVPLNSFTSRLAREWLGNQPASTIKAQAKAVVEETEKPEYLTNIRNLIESDTPVHLISGARSSDGWDVPQWANQLCTTRINIPSVGHLMMAESVSKFVSAILTCTRYGSDITNKTIRS